MCILLARSARLYLVSSPLVIPQSVYDPEKGILVDYPTYIFYNIWYIPADICITMSNWLVTTLCITLPINLNDFKLVKAVIELTDLSGLWVIAPKSR